MKRTLVLLGALLNTVALPVLAQRDPPAPAATGVAKGKPQDAKVLMDAAMKKAKDQKKAVLVVFDASW